MLNFSDLLATLQNAAEQAAHAVALENIKLFKSYFNPSPKDNDENNPEEMTPIMVTLKYPTMTKDGPVEHAVHVPLISLSPISSLQLSDVNIEMDLEIVEKDGLVLVGFPQVKQNIFGQDKIITPKANAKIKMTIKSGGRTEGLKSIIEGYDKALRAQIPH